MIGFNHGTVGALLGKFLPLPIALPLAIASHFILDSLPHYGLPHKTRDKSVFWKILFTVDFFATVGLAIFTITEHQYAWLICGFIAVAPDFVWVSRLLRTGTQNGTPKSNVMSDRGVSILRYRWQ